MEKIDWQTYATHNKEMIHGFFGDYRWMSNFHYAPINIEGYRFQTNEHAFQFAKLPLVESKDYRYGQVINLTPYESKKWIREIGLRQDWEEIKHHIMLNINFDKFYRHKDLRELLFKTGDAHLEETNIWHDNIWGNCVCKRCEHIEGKNALGLILMKTREYLKV